jgi:hypothetical protein
MENMIITCIQCEEDFEFTGDEQKKFEKRGFDIPLRCPQCRKHKFRDVEDQEHRRPKNKKKNHRQNFDEYYD